MDMTSRRTFLKLAALAAPSVTPLGSLSAWGMTRGHTLREAGLPASAGLAHLRKGSLRTNGSALMAQWPPNRIRGYPT